jgi:adenylylsulfate kinase
MKILICGLPGSGKTTLADQLHEKLQGIWYNADEVRHMNNDWDFSIDGRKRQALRMRNLAEYSESQGIKYVICDFVAPTIEIQNIFNPDYVIWMNTIEFSRYPDTNILFEPPQTPDLIIQDFNYTIDSVVNSLYNEIP